MDTAFSIAIPYIHNAAERNTNRAFLSGLRLVVNRFGTGIDFSQKLCPLDGGQSGGDMKTKTKNILTAVVLVAVAVAIYVFAVLRAISQ